MDCKYIMTPAGAKCEICGIKQENNPSKECRGLCPCKRGEPCEAFGGITLTDEQQNMCEGKEICEDTQRAFVSEMREAARVGMATKAVNFATAAFRAIIGGWRTMPEEKAVERLELCMACPQNLDGECAACGCKVELKVHWPEEQCPLDEPKWTRYDSPVSPKQKKSCCG